MDTASLKDVIISTLKEIGYEGRINQAPLDTFYRLPYTEDRFKRAPEVQRRDFQPKGNVVSIIPICDLHLGAYSFMSQAFDNYINYILSNDDVYTIGIGDLVENATKTSVGLGLFEEEMHLDEQLDILAAKLEPLVKAGKLLGLQTGNHEHRTEVLVGLNPMKILAKRLGVPYLRYQAYFKWVVGDQIYHAMTVHGRGNSQTAPGKLNAVMKNINIADVDIYIVGHMHDKIDYVKPVYYIDDATDTLQVKERHFVVAGSLLSYWGSYAEMNALVPTMPGLVRIDLYADEKRVKVYK